jgi:hypothetical protein
MKTPQNKTIYDALRDETYPEFVKKKVEPVEVVETAEETVKPKSKK